MKNFVAGTLLLAALAAPAFAAGDSPAATATPAAATAPKPMSKEQAAFNQSLHKQTGDVALPAANATLHLGNRYYFLGPDEAKKVLTDIWGNPPSEAEGTLGLVLPAGTTVFDDSWGAIITFNDSGYVTDDDADSADYDKVLSDLRSGEDEDNAQRVKGGYKAIHLVGWAQPPSYDKATHSLIWARDLKFDGAPVDGLNYDVRILGRKGVLSMNMLWDMSHLAQVRAAAIDFGKTATFNGGSTYAEFDGKVDKAAGYGLAGLVAAGVGLVVVKKLGLLAILFGFGKWILIGLAAAGAAMRKWAGGLFRRKTDTLEG